MQERRRVIGSRCKEVGGGRERERRQNKMGENLGRSSKTLTTAVREKKKGRRQVWEGRRARERERNR